MTAAGADAAAWQAASDLALALSEQVQAGHWDEAAELELTLADHLRALLAEQPRAAGSVGASARLGELRRIANVYVDALDRLAAARAAAARELGGVRAVHRHLGAYLSVAGAA